MSVITALTVCASFVSASLRTDLSAQDWKSLNRFSITIIRIFALAAGYWLFSETPTKAGRYLAALAYAALYVVSERAAWRRKRAVEAGGNLQS